MLKIQNLQDLTNYLPIPQEALAFVLQAGETTPNGRYEFGESCYVNVMECDTRAELAPMEAHVDYIDVQIVLVGEEKIYVTAKAPLTVTEPYNAEKDIAFYAWENGEAVTYQSGEAVVLYPEEAHLPCRAANEPMTIKKAVLKLKADAVAR